MRESSLLTNTFETSKVNPCAPVAVGIETVKIELSMKGGLGVLED